MYVYLGSLTALALVRARARAHVRVPHWSCFSSAFLNSYSSNVSTIYTLLIVCVCAFFHLGSLPLLCLSLIHI